MLDLDGQAEQRRRHGVPHEGVLLAAELPSELPHKVVHRHQRLDPGKLYPWADPRAAPEGDEGERRRRRRPLVLGLKPGRVELGRLVEDARVHVRHVRRPEHLKAFRSAYFSASDDCGS